jgi:tetratricopeptide (TPR) repeat protein
MKKEAIPPSKRKYLERVMEKADSQRAYAWAVREFEKINKVYFLDTTLEYQLGLLYDHWAIKLNGKGKSSELFTKAKGIYKSILKKEPYNPLALHGLARVESETGDYTRAIQYDKKAYESMKKRPKKERGPLAIGNVFLLAGKDKEAEKWFLREYKEFGNKNLAAVANVVIFYEITKQYKKALSYAKKLEKLLKKEEKFKKHKAEREDETIKLLLKRIENIKNAQ